MRRREFIAGLGGAAAWPLAGRTQQPAIPMVGFISGVSAQSSSKRMAAFRQGLRETGTIEGRNVTIEYRWAEDQYDRLPALAAELVSRPVAVIVTHTDAAAFAAKAATSTIPIVFMSGGDPVRAGIVSNLNRPGGNITGVTYFGVDLVPKRLGLLHELVPNTAVIALLMDQNMPDAVSQVSEVQDVARTLGLQLVVLNARTARDIDAAFETLVRERAGALVVSASAFLISRREQIIALAARHAVPAIYSDRESAEDGGLISYGNSRRDVFRRAGNYAGRILNGAPPTTLPVERAVKFELVINLKTAKALGLTVPNTLLVSAEEVIE